MGRSSSSSSSSSITNTSNNYNTNSSSSNINCSSGCSNNNANSSSSSSSSSTARPAPAATTTTARPAGQAATQAPSPATQAPSPATQAPSPTATTTTGGTMCFGSCGSITSGGAGQPFSPVRAPQPPPQMFIRGGGVLGGWLGLGWVGASKSQTPPAPYKRSLLPPAVAPSKMSFLFKVLRSIAEQYFAEPQKGGR